MGFVKWVMPSPIPQIRIRKQRDSAWANGPAFYSSCRIVQATRNPQSRHVLPGCNVRIALRQPCICLRQLGRFPPVASLIAVVASDATCQRRVIEERLQRLRRDCAAGDAFSKWVSLAVTPSVSSSNTCSAFRDASGCRQSLASCANQAPPTNPMRRRSISIESRSSPTVQRGNQVRYCRALRSRANWQVAELKTHQCHRRGIEPRTPRWSVAGQPAATPPRCRTRHRDCHGLCRASVICNGPRRGSGDFVGTHVPSVSGCLRRRIEMLRN